MFEFGASYKQNWISIKGSDASTSWLLRCPKPDLDPPGTKSVSGRLKLSAAAPCSALRLNFRAGNHLPRTTRLRLPTSPFLANQYP